MQDNPLVTVICLCYNHTDFVLESLRSVLNQQYKNIELLIVDDCSTDNSKSVIEKWLLDYPQIPFIANETNLGNTKSFNNALKIAKGEYIIDLAADDVLLSNCILQQIHCFINSPYKNLGIVYGNLELITEEGVFDSYYFPVDPSGKVTTKRITGDIYESVLSGGDSICSVSSMVKKSLFNALNGYDESLAYEDLDFWIRASRTYEFDFIDTILVQKRIVNNSLGTHFFIKKDAKAKKINQSTYLILKKAIGINKTKKEDKAILKRIHFEMNLAYKTYNNRLLLRYIIMETKLRFHLLVS